MKVFLSWSGEISHKIAMTFRNWLPSVIQSIIPYVSSEDIDKGARWSSDIAKELEDSTFGILCVTRDNIDASWLNFEAGALSKTIDKSLVIPFLFDIKRSEVNGPILQFQSTTFEKEDIKKLVFSLNKACEQEQLSDERLEKAFSVWYSSLEDELNKIKKMKDEHSVEVEKTLSEKDSAILEEILELTRINQKLIRNPEGVLVETVTKINESLNKLQRKILNALDSNNSRSSYRNIHLSLLEEFFYTSKNRNSYISFLVILCSIRDDFPLIYDVGKEVIEILKSKRSKQGKFEAINEFKNIVDLSFRNPISKEIGISSREIDIIYNLLSSMASLIENEKID
jgi:hypothetical protein